MATRADKASWGGLSTRAADAGRRGGALIAALAILGGTLALGFALASYRTSDAAFNTAAGGRRAMC